MAQRAWRGIAASIVVALVGLVPFAPAHAEGPTPTGEEVMRQVDARPRGRDQSAHATWRLLAPGGGERVRETRNYWRDARTGPDRKLHSQRLIVFESPPDVKGTAFLTWSANTIDADDDQWIYLPALKKVRRIAVGDRGSSFVGTDFAYDDLAERQVEEDMHELLRTEEIDGRRHYVVQSVPRGASPYAKRVSWVDAVNFTVPQIQLYSASGELVKTLSARWRPVQDIFTWERLEMKNERTGHRTVVEVDQVIYDRGLGEDLFTENALRAGAP